MHCHANKLAKALTSSATKQEKKRKGFCVCFVKPSLNSFSEKATITVYAVWKCINNLPTEQSNGTKSYVYLLSSTYDLVPKGAQMGGRIFLLSIKSVLKHFVLLLLCVCVHHWSVSQWKQYELQI